MSSRCSAGVSVLTTQQAITVRSAPSSTTIVLGGLRTAAAGSPTLVRVNVIIRTAQLLFPYSLNRKNILIHLSLQSASATATPTAATSLSGCGSPRAAPAAASAITANTTRLAAGASAVAAVTTVTRLFPSAPHSHANVRDRGRHGAVRGIQL